MQQFVTYNALVGLEIERLRKMNGIDQAELAAKAGLSQPVLSRLEKGKAAITVDQLFMICNALGKMPHVVLEKVCENITVIKEEETVQITSSKSVDNTGPLLAGAALGAILTYLLSKK